MVRLSKLSSWTFPEWSMVLQGALLLCLMRIGLSLFSFRQVARTVKRAAHLLRRRRSSDSRYFRRVVWAIPALAKRMLPERPCLPQALAVQFLFLRSGKPATLHIGVDKDENDRLIAHAWVECEGEVVVGGNLSPVSYSELPDVESKL